MRLHGARHVYYLTIYKNKIIVIDGVIPHLNSLSVSVIALFIKLNEFIRSLLDFDEFSRAENDFMPNSSHEPWTLGTQLIVLSEYRPFLIF